MRVRCMCSRERPRFLRSLSRSRIHCSRSLTESQPTQSLMRLRDTMTDGPGDREATKISRGASACHARAALSSADLVPRNRTSHYWPPGVSCSGAAGAGAGVAPAAWRGACGAGGVSLGAGAGAGAPVVLLGGCSWGVMMLTGGIEEEDGK